jgi:hypothetical protein
MDVALALLAFVALAAVLTVAPLRRARRGRRAASRPPPSRQPRSGAVLGVCGSCLEIVEAHATTTTCPACGGELHLQRRIVERGRRHAAVGR